MYPQAILFGLAFFKKDRNIFSYTIPLSLLGGIVALYHTYIQFGGTSITPCTAVGAECAKVFFVEFGYITIPTMSLSIFALLLLVAYANKIRIRSVN